ncbi:MAG: hypothetical protein R3F59_38005, partial [Myxococcota bacterium]
DNVDSYVRVVFGNNDTIASDVTWSALSVPYRIEDRFYVDGALTVQPGAVLDFAQHASLRVEAGGSLTAEGTADAPIVFQGASSGTRGYWQGISIDAGGTEAPLQYGATFDHCVIADAGSDNWNGRPDTSAGLWLGGAGSARITNTTFRNHQRYALWAGDAARIDGFGDNTLTGNGEVMLLHADRVGELAGTSTVSGNDADLVSVGLNGADTVGKPATWRSLGVPYAVIGTVEVDADLTLDAGVTLQFAEDLGLVVHDGASLVAAGTPEAPVTLTGATSAPGGTWSGLRFDSTAGNELVHTVVSQAGSDRWTGDPESAASLYVADDAWLTLTDVAVGPGGGFGVYLSNTGSMLSCSGVTFSGNADGPVYDDDNDVVYPGC